MKWILLFGAAVNAIGGCGLLFGMFIKIPYSFHVLPSADTINPGDYVQYRIFTSGTAFTFASMYTYLYCHPEYAIPFLFFGMALKYWAFLAALIALLRYKMPKDIFFNFGVMNLVVAVLFTYYLLNV